MKTRPPSLRYLGAALLFSICALGAEAKDRQGDPSTFTWNPELSTSGPVVVAVSLKNQQAAVYRNGIKIGACLVSTGKPGHETPTGVFHILNKDADHHSSTYNNASMPFSERLTWGGVALHAGSLPGYPSSHGCIHLPYEFSRKLFSITNVGTTVVITNDSPDIHVSNGHHVHFRPGDRAEIIWQPEASVSGPVSLLYSSADERLYVIRGGLTIGECPVKAKSGFFSNKISGTSSFLFAGWTDDSVGGRESSTPNWVHIGGSKGNHAEPMDEWFEIDPRFEHLLHGILVHGTNLVLTDEPVTKKTRSNPGFNVMSGPEVEKALKQPATKEK
ncbi:MAG: L,D-transpeptidase family protein [Verrucomicrobiales bacterium]